MVAYSFQSRFIEPILAGSKRQTIRADRRRHARAGEELQLYAGMRTRHCRLIARASCQSVTPVRLTFHRGHGPLVFHVGGQVLSADEMEAFAVADGFGAGGGFAVLDMCAFWLDRHGPRGEDMLTFSGWCIAWGTIHG